jgi:diguanylate cyclase
MGLNLLVYAALGACLVAVAIMLGSVFAGLLRRLRESDERYRVLVEQRAELLERLGRMARTDDLTGLPNRRAWEEELPREIARALRGDTTVCVAMLDLDRFKGYNDARGHQAGDRLLKRTAAAWHSELRPYDLLARYGGEEFGLILPGCGLAEAVGAVERLRAATPEEMSCSAGIAEWDRDEHPHALVGRADQALYKAKRSGRNRTIPARAARASA